MIKLLFSLALLSVVSTSALAQPGLSGPITYQGGGGSSGSGGGSVNSVSNSDGSLTISPTSGNVVASINVNNANTWTASQTFSGVTLSGITGSTQCLQVNSSGIISGTGAGCGGSGGGLTVGTTTISGGTNGDIEFNNSGVLGEVASSGTGNVVRVTSPTLVTPIIGAATGTSLALGGATIGSNALNATGNITASGNISGGALIPTGTATPALGLFATGGGSLRFATSSTLQWVMGLTTGNFTAANASGPGMQQVAATASIPTIWPNETNTTTGIGAQGNNVSMIQAGVEIGRFTSTGYIQESGQTVLKNYTVSTLPTGTTGGTAYVTDAVTCTFLGTLTGSGTTVCPVFYNGTAWVAN